MLTPQPFSPLCLSPSVCQRCHFQCRLLTCVQPQPTNRKRPRRNLTRCLTPWQRSTSRRPGREVRPRCLIMTWLSSIPAANKVRTNPPVHVHTHLMSCTGNIKQHFLFLFSFSISDSSNSSSDHSELFSLPVTNPDRGEAGYLSQAAVELTAAMEREKEGEYSSAIRGYRTAVDILITGAQGETDRAGGRC